MTLYTASKASQKTVSLKDAFILKPGWQSKCISALDTEGAVDERTGQSHFSIQVNVHDIQSKFCMQISLMSARKDFEWQTFNNFTVNKDCNSISPNCCFFHHFKEIKKQF